MPSPELVQFAAIARQTKFLVEFANAIDIIVRGIKSGLPLPDCLQIIATESPEPVKSALEGAGERHADLLLLYEVDELAHV